jgi:hypothetical protein
VRSGLHPPCWQPSLTVGASLTILAGSASAHPKNHTKFLANQNESAVGRAEPDGYQEKFAELSSTWPGNSHRSCSRRDMLTLSRTIPLRARHLHTAHLPLPSNPPRHQDYSGRAVTQLRQIAQASKIVAPMSKNSRQLPLNDPLSRI